MAYGVSRIELGRVALRPCRTTWRAYSITATCMPRQMPRNGTSCSRANCAAMILPSMPRHAEAARNQDAVVPEQASRTSARDSASASTKSRSMAWPW